MVLHLNTWNHYRLSVVRIATDIFVQAPYAMAVSVCLSQSWWGYKVFTELHPPAVISESFWPWVQGVTGVELEHLEGLCPSPPSLPLLCWQRRRWPALGTDVPHGDGQRNCQRDLQHPALKHSRAQEWRKNVLRSSSCIPRSYQQRKAIAVTLSIY